ncbi:MAG: DoxX family protein [Elusimicrobia bacterium]|nr:DoxX family protein [Elusimicrobiota bacterium]
MSSVELDDLLALLGRLFLSAIFLASAFGKITNFDGTVQYMEVHGLPWAPLLCAGAVGLEVLGGISLLLGYGVRWGAAALAAFVIAVSLIFHSSPDQRLHLLKNMGILGGLLQVMAFGAGGLSLDGRGRA